MIHKIFRILILLFLLPCCCHAHASWFINIDKFHASAHGRLSCNDCHFNIDLESHPEPADVNRSVNDFFNPDQCAACHYSVDEYVAQGIHGQIPVTESEDIENCIYCHDPHYESSAAADLEDFDPSQPINRQCGICHENRKNLPAFEEADRACVGCHRILINDESGEAARLKQFCFYCHGDSGKSSIHFDKKKRPDRIDTLKYAQTPHGDISCSKCHSYSGRFPHSNQKIVECRQCHPPHDEKTIHDAHTRISCLACHQPGAEPKIEENRIIPNPDAAVSVFPSQTHQVRIMDKKTSCKKCHFKGNTIGAASLVLPPKSMICMPCHTATFSANDTVTVVSLAIFVSGLISVFFILLAGYLGGNTRQSKLRKLMLIIISAIRAIFSFKLFMVLRALLIDVLFQKRLFKQDLWRWMVHGLIFYPFVLRFCWGITALLLSLYFPQYSVTQWMLDKNHPFTALFFDLTGIFVMMGIVVLIIHKKHQPSAGLSSMPRPDWPAMGLLGGIMIIGYILEGMRIAMTGNPVGATYAFLGYSISLFFPDAQLVRNTYGYIWYLHAIFTGLFLAYLPFSRMMHTLIAPIILSINAIKSNEKMKRNN